MGHPILNMCAAGEVSQSIPAGSRKLNRSKFEAKTDGLVALSNALGTMSVGEVVNATSARDYPFFKKAVQYQWFSTTQLTETKAKNMNKREMLMTGVLLRTLKVSPLIV